jgi:hypothetical protein
VQEKEERMQGEPHRIQTSARKEKQPHSKTTEREKKRKHKHPHKTRESDLIRYTSQSLSE